MLRKVIDSNALQHEMLRNFLARSPSNFAVLTDYAAMEAYKGDTLASIFKSMSILSQHPKQVIVLKTTGVLCGLRGRLAGLERRMIDQDQTREFAKYCKALDLARQGDKVLEHQLLDHGRVADEQMAKMLNDAKTIPEAIEGIAAGFSAEELKIIRHGTSYSSGLIRHLLDESVKLSAILFRDHPRPTDAPNIDELANTYLFRTSLCALFWAFEWIRVGGPKDVRTDRIRNDMVDLNFAVTATYFDGLMTMDQKPRRIYEHATFVLDAIAGGRSRNRP